MADQQQKLEVPERFFYLDVLRCFAAFAVVVIHVAAPVFYELKIIGYEHWLAVNFWDSMSRWAVPVFFMISGMFILDPARKLPLRTLFTARLPKLLVPLILWSLVYLAWEKRLAIFTGEPLALADWFLRIWQGPVLFHLWFLYSLIGLYVMAPVLRLITEHKNKTALIYLFAGWFIFNGIHNFLAYFSSIKTGVELPAFHLFTGYFLIGYYISVYNFSKSQLKIIGALTIAGFVVTFFGTWWFMALDRHGEAFYQYYSPSVIVTSVGILILARQTRWDKGLWAIATVRHLITQISLLSFGIYLSHLLVIEVLKEGYFGITITGKSLYPLLGVPLVSLLVFTICLFLTKILRLLPGVKWLVP